MSSRNSQIVLIGISRAGWFANGLDHGNTMSVSTYETTEEPPPSLLENAEGAWVVDGRRLELGVIVDEAFAGPMLDVQLARGMKRSWTKTEPAVEPFGGLDFVALDIYIARKRAKGFRLGQVRGRGVVWEW